MGAIIPDGIIGNTSLVTPDGRIPTGSYSCTLARLNIRLAAEENPELIEHVLDWQAGIDPLGGGSCYDIARPELAHGIDPVEPRGTL